MNKTIMIVEDEGGIRFLLQTALEELGFKILTAENGVQALKLMPHHSIDLFLLDMLMPEMDGLTLLDRIREKDSLLPPVFILTALGEVIPDECFQRGAQKVICKPFDAALVAKEVQAYLK